MIRRRCLALVQQGWKCAQGSASSTSSVETASSCPHKLLIERHIRFQHTSRYKNKRGYEHFRQPPSYFGGGGGLSGGTSIWGPTVVVVGGAGIAIIWYSSRQEIPYTHRMHSMLVTLKQERKLGKAAFQEVIEGARGAGTLLPPQHPASQQVLRVGSRIAALSADDRGGGYFEHMKGLDWEFVVIESNNVNAFVVPGGKVVVFTELLKLVESDDELAAILAHEIAHVVARHAMERITHQSVVAVVQLLLAILLNITIPESLTNIAFSLPNSRSQETEADIIGCDLAARACYDPAASASVFKKLGIMEEKMDGSKGLELLRTHPMSAKRVEAIEAHLPKAMLWFEKAGCEPHVRDMFFRAFSPSEPRKLSPLHSAGCPLCHPGSVSHQ